MTVRADTPRARGDRSAPHASPVTPDEDIRTILISRVSWAAVLAGVAVALVVQLILNLLGIGLGAATIDPATGDSPFPSTFSIGAVSGGRSRELSLRSRAGTRQGDSPANPKSPLAPGMV